MTIALEYEPSVSVISRTQHPTWSRILKHCGQALDEVVKTSPFAKENRITNGGKYLRVWIASMIRRPETSLPYLYFYGNQNCGKSMFREAVEILFKTGSVVADYAMLNETGWNGELEDAVFCYLEEVGFGYELNDARLDRLREYVTQPELVIHILGKAPHTVPNLTHWCQMSNRREDFPSCLNDSSAVILRITDLEYEIPKGRLLRDLREEAPHFMKTLMDLQLPQVLPAIITGD